MFKSFVWAVLLSLILGTGACKNQDSSTEEMGEAIDEQVEEVQEAVGIEEEGTFEKAGKAVDEQIEETGEAIEEAGDAVEDATN